MDVASTSGRVSLSWSEIVYLRRINSLLSRSKSARLFDYEQRVPTTASAGHCRAHVWHQQCFHHGSVDPPSPKSTDSALFRQGVPQRNVPTAVLAPAAPLAAGDARRHDSRSSRHHIQTPSGATPRYNSSPATASSTVAGQQLAPADGPLSSTRVAPLGDTADKVDGDGNGVEGDTGFQYPPPPPLAAALPPPLRLQLPQAPRLNPVSQAALNRQIIECTDWLSLEVLYRSLRSPAAAAATSSSPLGGPQLVAMARHLARLPRHRSYAKFEDERLQLFASELAAATVPYLGEMAQGEYCALLWAYGKVDCHPGQDFLAALLPRLQPLLATAGPTGLSQALWGLARMGAVPSAAFLTDFYAAATAALRRRSANPQHVSNILWACVILRLQPPAELLNQALAVMDGKVQDASPQALALTAWAMVQLGEGPPPLEWWRRVQGAALGLRGKLQPQDIAHLAWATARSGHPPPPDWLGAMCSEAYGCMRGFRAQELCNLLWGLVVSGYKPQDSWLTTAITAAQNLLPTFKAFELAVLLWCLASLQARPLLPRAFAGALFFHSGPKLGFLSAQDCANVIWSLARLQLRPPEPWMAAFVEESFTQLPHFTPQHLANTMWGFARLSRCPPEPWMDRFFLESRPLLLSFKTSELAMLALALGISRLEPPRQWLNQLLVASYSKVEHCSAQELAHLVWGLWRLSFKPPQRWLEAVAEAASRLVDRGGPITPIDLVTLDRAFGTFGAELPVNVRQVLEAATAAAARVEVEAVVAVIGKEEVLGGGASTAVSLALPMQDPDAGQQPPLPRATTMATGQEQQGGSRVQRKHLGKKLQQTGRGRSGQLQLHLKQQQQQQQLGDVKQQQEGGPSLPSQRLWRRKGGFEASSIIHSARQGASKQGLEASGVLPEATTSATPVRKAEVEETTAATSLRDIAPPAPQIEAAATAAAPETLVMLSEHLPADGDTVTATAAATAANGVGGGVPGGGDAAQPSVVQQGPAAMEARWAAGPVIFDVTEVLPLAPEERQPRTSQVDVPLDEASFETAAVPLAVVAAAAAEERRREKRRKDRQVKPRVVAAAGSTTTSSLTSPCTPPVARFPPQYPATEKEESLFGVAAAAAAGDAATSACGNGSASHSGGGGNSCPAADTPSITTTAKAGGPHLPINDDDSTSASSSPDIPLCTLHLPPPTAHVAHAALLPSATFHPATAATAFSAEPAGREVRRETRVLAGAIPRPSGIAAVAPPELGTHSEGGIETRFGIIGAGPGPDSRLKSESRSSESGLMDEIGAISELKAAVAVVEAVKGLGDVVEVLLPQQQQQQQPGARVTGSVRATARRLARQRALQQWSSSSSGAAPLSAGGAEDEGDDEHT